MWGGSKKPAQAVDDKTLGTNVNPITLDEIPDPPEEDPDQYLRQQERLRASFKELPPPEVQTNQKQPAEATRRRSARIQTRQNEQKGLTAPDEVESPDRDRTDLWR